MAENIKQLRETPAGKVSQLKQILKFPALFVQYADVVCEFDAKVLFPFQVFNTVYYEVWLLKRKKMIDYVKIF